MKPFDAPGNDIVRSTEQALKRASDALSFQSEDSLHHLSPQAARIQLGKKLREIRKENQQDLWDIAGPIEWSASKVSRIETGFSGLKPGDFQKLIRRLNVPPEKYALLEQLYLKSIVPTSKRNNESRASDRFIAFADRLTGATALLQVACGSIPELLQTSIYAEHLEEKNGNPAKQIMQLQRDILASNQHLEQFYILEESLFRREIGTHLIIAQQIDHIVAAAQETAIDVWVSPFTHGPAGQVGAFAVVHSLSSSLEDVAYIRNPICPDNDVWKEVGWANKPKEETPHPSHWFSALAQHALSPLDSIDFLQKRASELRQNKTVIV